MFLLSSINCRSQILSNADSISRSMADDVLKTYYNQYLKKNRLLLFSVSDEIYYVILEKGHVYEEYFLKLDSKKTSKPKLVCSTKKPNNLLSKAFLPDTYHKGYVTHVENAELQQGNLSYFVLRDINGDRWGEYRESLIIKPPPIDPEIYSYLLKKVARGK